MEILSGGMGAESKLLKIKPTKDPKQAKTGGKDGKSPAGGGTQAAAAAGGAAEAEKGQAAEVMPVEAPPEVQTGFFFFQKSS